MKRATQLKSLAALATTATLLTGCAVGGGEASDADPTDTLRVTLDIPTTLDPTQIIALPDSILSRMSFDTLVRKDDSGLVPGLADSWESTPLGADLVIREGGTCSDGTPITASLVKDSLEFFANSGSVMVDTTFGAEPAVITADDATRTVKIQLGAEWPFLMDALSVASSGIICPAGLADPEALAIGSVEGAESGPYVLSAVEPGVKYTYEMRDDYEMWPEWTTDLPGKPAQTMVYSMAPDPSAAANMVKDGQLDIAKIMPETMARFDGDSENTISTFLFSDNYVLFNERPSSAFTDPALRKAVAQVLDQAALEKVVMGGNGELSTTFMSSATQCYTGDDSAKIAYDPQAGAKVLDGVKIRFVGTNIFGVNGSGNTYVQEALRAAGADVTMDNVDLGTWISRLYDEPDSWDMTVYLDLNYIGSLASALGQMQGETPENGGSNMGGTNNPEAAQLFADAQLVADDAARCDALNAAGTSLIKNADAIPVMVDKYIYAQRPGFESFMLGGSIDDHIFRIVK
ncbi:MULTISPECIES: ABC transporter substrate-binding protein [unclassified Leucobacter]|uniref:ABC transporter substrate-binding protein n=1 Tax=unclassified Leucobacter TaxID=2621730 RepID=UPI00165D54F5|nr:ABC transporter substrate-binding protein [Leucobacter sp. cx-87]